MPKVIVEADFMPVVRQAWAERCKSDGMRLGTKRRAHAMEVYLQGILAIGSAVGIIGHDRCNQIAFLVSVGRGEELLAVREGG